MTAPLVGVAQSALDAQSFRMYWTVESESSDYCLTFSGDTCDIVSPKGLTLWRKQKMSQGMAVEYDVMVVDEGQEGDRLSDMNCFWLASDPQAKDVFAGLKQRQGIFKNCYALQMYYLGYGGNHNTTTRFRRYEGGGKVPPIWTEYTDADYLLKANHWYHWRVESIEGRTRMFVDGRLIVDYLDPEPLQSGWFGFRTTLSHTRITHFNCYSLDVNNEEVPLHWVGDEPQTSQPVSFGVPFAQGELSTVDRLTLNNAIPTDAWVNARWPDGSVKWAGVAAVIPADSKNLKLLMKGYVNGKVDRIVIDETARGLTVSTGRLSAYFSKQGEQVIDSMVVDGQKVGGAARLVASTTQCSYVSQITNVSIERQGRVAAVIRIDGSLCNASGRRWLPFTLRLYFYQGSEQMKLVHSFVYDGDAAKDIITSLGLQFAVPMRAEMYNRHVSFAMDDNRWWHEPVQPLEGRSPLARDTNWHAVQMRQERVPAYDTFDERGRKFLDAWASWDGFRLSQLTDNAFSVRKRATDQSPWIGTFTGQRSPGMAVVGDVEGGLAVSMNDFWQSYPSTMQVDGARSEEARLTMYLWSPEAEAMNLCHYDTIAHDLLASYEDVQEGMSTPYGIGRTTTFWVQPFKGQTAVRFSDSQLLPTPQYLHQKRAFGLWSLPSQQKAVEQRLDNFITFYQKETERCKWYGFWNYGDVMHAYDRERQEWRYDVGGYAWDNTELATPMWLWYNFLRTGRVDIWRMAEAMTRHNSEVDTYHTGPFAPLGSRHNVSHWGCGAKEARISQAAFLRFYYYLTTDERTGDLMREQRDCDTLLWHLDPMRLAEPREKFPCSAPARLRIGPDWLAYAGNWMTEWERTGDDRYHQKIENGMRSIAGLRDGLFTGNKAMGYDPATGILSYDGPDSLRNTNHLMTIMGGFEVMNELMPMMRVPSFEQAWLDHARRYRETVRRMGTNKFPVRRLDAYAAWKDRDAERKQQVWRSLLRPSNEISTNDAALWSLDAIYMLEIISY